MATSQIVILDDGELVEIRALLDELGVNPATVRSGAAGAEEPTVATRLLVATVRHALIAPVPAPAEGSRPVRLAILPEAADSESLRGRLRERGFDYIVRLPVHPEALRLLLLRALYRGEERRIAGRLPMGSPASYRTGLWRRPALLADLSMRGCRLFTTREAPLDAPITVRLPRETTGGEPLLLPGRVVRCGLDAHTDPDLPFAVAIAFDRLSAKQDDRLRALLAAKAEGPASIQPSDVERAWRGRGLGKRAPVRLDTDRPWVRRAPRRRFRSRLAALGRRDRATRVLVGHDLSTGGMRVEPHPEIACGDRLSLALFGAPEQRIVVQARVVRDEGEAGLALRFENVEPETERRLEALLAGLPPLERRATLGGGFVRGVVTEMAQLAPATPVLRRRTPA